VRALRYSINVTLDGCCDHRAISADEEIHSHATKNLDQADALLFGRVTYEMALAELGLIDEYEFVVQPRLVGHGPTLFAGLSKRVDLRPVGRLEFDSRAVAMRYEPRT
jgi:dihydrofolate reductase